MIKPNQLLLVQAGIEGFTPGVHRVVLAASKEQLVALYWMGDSPSNGPLKPSAHLKKPKLYSLSKLMKFIDERLIQELPEIQLEAPLNQLRFRSHERDRFHRNWEILSPLVTPDSLYTMLIYGGWHKQTKHASEKHQISTITVHRLLARYFFFALNCERACEDRLWIKGIRRQITKKLGRPANRFKSGHRLSAEGRNATNDDRVAVAAFYSCRDNQAMSVSAMYRLFEQNFGPKKAVLAKDGNLTLVTDATRSCISESQFRYALRITQGELTLLQQKADERKINLNHRPAIGSARDRIPYPGHTFIIDATVGDIYLVSAFDRRRIIGRPVIYLVVDAFSSLILSVHVALEGPNFAQARIAMYRAISEKKRWLNWLGIGDIHHLFPQGCLPAFWLADRGEMHSKASRFLQTELRCNLSIAAAYRADWKSLVERLFGTINTLLIHWMPGAVAQRFRERGTPDNRLDAVFTLQEFTRILVRKVALLNLTKNMSDHMSAAFISADIKPNPIGFYHYGIQHKHGSAVFMDFESSMRKALTMEKASISRHGVLLDKAQYAASWMLDHPTIQLAGFSNAMPVNVIRSADDPLSIWCLLPNESIMREARLHKGFERASQYCTEDIQEMTALRSFLGQDLRDDTTQERLALEIENQKEIEASKTKTKSLLREAPVSNRSRINNIRTNRKEECEYLGHEVVTGQDSETKTSTTAIKSANQKDSQFIPLKSNKQEQEYFDRMSAQLSSWG